MRRFQVTGYVVKNWSRGLYNVQYCAINLPDLIAINQLFLGDAESVVGCSLNFTSCWVGLECSCSKSPVSLHSVSVYKSPNFEAIELMLFALAQWWKIFSVEFIFILFCVTTSFNTVSCVYCGS